MTVVPSVTLPPSATPTPAVTATKTPRPTNTRVPTRTPTLSATPLFFPLPGNPPELTITAAFLPRVERTDWETPTPIALPSAGQTYWLKNLSQEETLEMLRQVNDYAHVADIPTAGDFHADFAKAQLAVNLAARETLLRFPDLPEAEQTRWLLAYSDTLLNAGASHRWLYYDELLSSALTDEWLAAEIERRLNLGWLDPLDLSGGLESFGFEANPAYFASHEYDDFNLVLLPVDNLFGDGRPAYLWRISNVESVDPDGLYIAVSQQPDDRFRVVPLRSAWQFPLAGGTELDALDLTGDGQPEVIMYINDGEGGYRTVRTEIHQWRDDHFVEILHGNLGANNVYVFPHDNWEFAPPAVDGTVDIQAISGGLPELFYHSLLHWNGEWMEVARRWVELPEAKEMVDDYYMRTIGYAMEFGQTADLVGSLQNALDHPPETPDPSFADLIRFQLVMIAAQQSQIEEAKETLQSIIASPADPNYPLIPKAAATFLENYQGNADVYQNCRAALAQMYSPIISAFRRNPGANPFDVTRDVWGYSTSHVLLCGLRPAFRLLASSLPLGPETDVPAVLDQAGVSIFYSAHQDLDNDGRLDWLLVTDSQDTGYGVDAWVLLGTQDGYQPVPVFEYKQHWLGEEFEYNGKSVRLETLSLPGSLRPLQILQIGSNLWVWRVHHKDNVAEIETLLDLSDLDFPYVDRFEIHPNQNEIWTFNDTVSYRPAWSVYAWQEKAGGFTHIDPVERLIFETDHPQDAIPAIQAELALLKKDPPMYSSTLAARLTYLLGLSYELSGDPDNAVRVYLDVWRQFPETGFALLAQAKLEGR